MPDHVNDDDLAALALDELKPGDRARLSAHVNACESCRADYAAIEHSVRVAMAAAPAIAPPPGFSGRVLQAMGLDSDIAAAPSRPTVPAGGAVPAMSARRWSTALVAAAAALVLGVGLGVVGATALTSREPAAVGSVPGLATSASALVTRTGDTVGTAGLTTLAGRDYLVITVTKARPGMVYECVTVSGGGQRTSAGTWTLDDRYGGSQASGTWVVPVPAGGVERVELVTPTGTVWSHAEL